MMFKKIFCMHKTIHITSHKKYQSRFYLRQCVKCGKYFIYDKFNDSYIKVKNVNWEEWDLSLDTKEMVGADNG